MLISKKGDAMKEIRIDLPEDIEQIELHPLADLHIGDGLCDFKLIQEKLKYILEAKQDKHNNAIERLYVVEKRLDVQEEKLKVANNRIADLEKH